MNNSLFGDVNLWDEIQKKHQLIIKTIFDYNAKIENGNFLQYDNDLDVIVYYNFLTAHIIELLVNDNMLYLSNRMALLLKIDQSKICQLLDWEMNEKYRTIKYVNSNYMIKQIMEVCFDEQGRKFIEEVCAQDIVYSNTLGKEIDSLFNQITMAIILDCKGEEGVLAELSKIWTSSGRAKTKIENRFYNELRNNGALIRNRVFKHKNNYRSILDKVILINENEKLLDYRHDKNACQSALLHIINEKNGTCGTGFVISEDGYALTCAHVVEGIECAEEFYATIIIGDGYPVRNEDFDVYDSGYGKVLYSNSELDFALLKMEHYGSGFLPIEQKEILPELGDEVVVFGYPLGYEMPQSNFFGPNISFYKGYISSNQVWNGNSVTFLDIDVKSGNSGSPVISTKTGKVIGIISGAKVGGRIGLNEKMPYMIPIQHFIKLLNK